MTPQGHKRREATMTKAERLTRAGDAMRKRLPPTMTRAEWLALAALCASAFAFVLCLMAQL